MALDFPDSPTTGQEFSANGRTWYWTGNTWDSVLAAGGGGGGGSTDLGTFYGFKYDPVTAQLTMQSIDDGTTVRLPATTGREPRIRRPDDYREWVFTTRPLEFSWDTVRPTNLIVEVS